MSDGNLPELVRGFVDEPNLVSPGPRKARENMVAYRVLPGRFEVADVEQALTDVAARLSLRLAGRPGPITFYAWYDEQAGQLRCSLDCVEPTALAFGGPFRPVDTPGPVVERMAADEHPGLVPWSTLTAVRAPTADHPDAEDGTVSRTTGSRCTPSRSSTGRAALVW